MESKAASLDCAVGSRGYKGWSQGVITLIEPEITKNCSKIISGDRAETERVRREIQDWRGKESLQDGHTESELLRKAENCTWLREYFSHNLYNTKIELEFPIAWFFVVYESPGQFLRLLKILYRPQNAYCIHLDKKSKSIQTFFYGIAKCFGNIMIAKNRVDVHWGHSSFLQAQMSCLNDLYDYRDTQLLGRKWKYVINICGKELPLLTNAEIVKKLIYLNGTSSIVGWPAETWTMPRLGGKELPYNLAYYKSMTYNALSISFVKFFLENSTAISLYKFFLDTTMPEEHFYVTLFMMPGVPGGYDPNKKYFEVGHYFWRTNAEEIALPCFGETVHGICVVTYEDLPRIMKETGEGSNALFQNKYFVENDHVAMDCMEEGIVDRNRIEYQLECSYKLFDANNDFEKLKTQVLWVL